MYNENKALTTKISQQMHSYFSLNSITTQAGVGVGGMLARGPDGKKRGPKRAGYFSGEPR